MKEPFLEDKQDINSFLSFRYIPEKEFSMLEKLIRAAQKSNIKKKRKELIEKGQRALRKGFNKILSNHLDAKVHIVPLSGGVDSRTILGFLLDNVDKSNILTITFGTPGTLDFEIGQKVAKEVNVKNYSIDLTPKKFNWTEQFLIESAKEYERPTKLFRAREAYKYFFNNFKKEDYIVWSGFMGGELTGSHLPEKESETWNEAVDNFLGYNYKRVNLVSDDFEPVSVLPDEPFVDREVLSFDEQLDFGIRQPYYIKPSALSLDRFKAPYLAQPWLDFILNVPRKYRIGKNLFKDVVLEMYPEIFSIETTNMTGLPLSANTIHHKIHSFLFHFYEDIKKSLGHDIPSISTNHFDWNLELRRSDRLLHLVRKQLKDLEKRSCVELLEPINFLNQHLNGRDFGNEIKILTSLEIFLKCNEL